MKRSFGLLLVSLLFSTCSTSNAPTSGGNNTTATGQTITGTVRDSIGILLEGVTVTIEMNVLYSAKTDRTGIFTFENVPAGTYPIRAVLRGYDTDSQTVVVTKDSGSVVSFRLSKPTIPPDPTLMCDYRFSGTVTDSSGKHHDGTLTGGGFVADRFNQAASAFLFRGGSDLVTIPNSDDLNFRDTTDFTLCFWMRCDASPNGSRPLCKMDPAGSDIGYRFELVTGLMRAWVTTNLSSTLVSFNGPPVGTWHFYVLSISGKTGIATPWIDGVQINTLPGGGLRGSSTNSSPLFLGYQFKGALDEVRIYRRALGSSEVVGLYHEGGWQ